MAYATTRWNTNAHGALTKENVETFYKSEGFNTAVVDRVKGFNSGQHKHIKDFYLVALSGEYVVNIEGQTVKMKGGDVLRTPPGVVHEESVEVDGVTQVAYASKGTPEDTVFV
eukprot:g3201.t1